MTITYSDAGIQKTVTAGKFEIKSNYIVLDGKFLLGEEGGWIHISQLIQKQEANDNRKE
jgi:hypothetical protein